MSLRDNIFDDIDRVFLNVANQEFAETCLINGIEVSCDVQNDDLTEQSDTRDKGIYKGSKLVFVSKNALQNKPSIDSRFTLYGKSYSVIDVNEEIGMFAIRITANKN